MLDKYLEAVTKIKTDNFEKNGTIYRRKFVYTNNTRHNISNKVKQKTRLVAHDQKTFISSFTKFLTITTTIIVVKWVLRLAFYQI